MTNTGHVDELKRRTFFEVLGLLRQTGGVSRRVRIARHAPELDTALGRLLDVMNDWDEQKYLAMLTSEHKRNVPMPVEQAELAGYAKFHGRCESFELVRYDSSDHGRYRLNCERGTFEMELNLSDGLIAGFVGTSSDVSAEPEVVALAQAELARWSKLETNRKRHGRCTIGTLRNRDGNRWYRFAIGCERGPDSIAALRLKAEAPAATETFEVEPVGGGGCGLLAPG